VKSRTAREVSMMSQRYAAARGSSGIQHPFGVEDRSAAIRVSKGFLFDQIDAT
jgi:hypothetical protein